MQRKTEMTKNRAKLIFVLLFAVALTFVLSGCGRQEQSIDGLNVVTFELGGGTLEMKTSSVDTKINFAYHPGTYILDPVNIPGYRVYRSDYNFTGWYTSPDCKPSEKWDFKTPFNTKSLTLYAGWEKAIKYTYTVYYVDNGEAKSLGSYDVKAGESFSDWRKFAESRSDHTPTGFYSDSTFATPWDDSFTHPGGAADTDVAVYVDYIDGIWTLVDSFSKLKSALKSGENVYLTADVDCGGEILVDPSLTTSYGGIFEGNGYTVSNFKVPKSGSLRPSIAIFKTLAEGAEIRNVSFTSVTYDLTGVGENVSAVKASAIATDARGAKISSVSVSGTLKTNYTKETLSLKGAIYETEAVAEITDFVSNVTVDIQN